MQNCAFIDVICTFIVNYLLLYVLITIRCKLPEDDDNAETRRNLVIERIHCREELVGHGM